MYFVSRARSAMARLNRLKTWRGSSIIPILALACASAHVLAAVDSDEESVDLRPSVDGQSYWAEQVIGGLDLPSAMVWLPNGDMLVSERSGNLRRVHKGTL